MNTEREKLESDLCQLIARYGSLSGKDWMDACDHVGHGYFHDMPQLVDVGALTAALGSELSGRFVANY